MKKLLSLAFLIISTVVLPLQAVAQQSAPATTKPSTPAAKRSTPAAARSSSSTPSAANLPMPVEARRSTPAPARSAASEPDTATPKAHANNWEVYPPDQMPDGKSLTELEAAKLASGDYSEKVLYLVGTFYVAVAQKDRAILWPGEKLGPVHVVVSYPLSIPIPGEGAKVVREAPRGFRITRIKHTSGDEVTIYVRDITVP